jgi:ribose 5-phosphate isomerase B
MTLSKIGIAGDHAGFELKETIISHLKNKGFEVKDFGPFLNESVDYADFAHPLANDVEDKTVDLGILICGSGNGINMTANKHQGVRSALCWLPELAALAKKHNNANVLSLPARFITTEVALQCVEEFINNVFEGGRHQNRIDKIPV